jgi:hypothetical protein
MTPLVVDTVGLRMLAAHCQSWAAEVGTASVPEPDSLEMSCQATSAAVSAVHASLGRTREALAGRMQSTAANLIAAAFDYSDTDELSAAQLRDLPTAL